jgi:hypothetical protein
MAADRLLASGSPLALVHRIVNIFAAALWR